MSNGLPPETQIAVMQEWRKHVDAKLDDIDKGLRATRVEMRDGLREVRDDIGTISRHVGRPLMTWPQVATIATAIVSALGGIAVVGVAVAG